MGDIDVVFFDVGGVVLSNGWDSDQRLAACQTFGLDFSEFEDRHQFVVDRFETGHIDHETYLQWTVFHQSREFTLEEFADSMKAASSELPDGLDLVREVASEATVATLNNESRFLNNYRIQRFGLNEVFVAFFSSCYLGVRKPDDAIYRIAAAVTGGEPHRCIFIDDRPINLEGALQVGIQVIHHVDPETTRTSLAELGV